jgi:hypothetical protein
MDEKRYKVVAEGKSDNVDITTVKNNLSRLLRKPVQELDVFFQGKPVVVRKGVTRNEALQYQAAMQKAGLSCVIRPLDSTGHTVSQPPPPPSHRDDRPMMICPKCGFKQEKSHSCIKCHIAVEKYLKTQEEKARLEPDPPPASDLPVPPLPPGMVDDEPFTGDEVPWEARDNGLLSDLFSTIMMALFKPFQFYSDLRRSSGLSKPVLFGVICGTLGFIFNLIWQVVFLGSTGNDGAQAWFQSPAISFGLILLIVLVLSPAITLFIIFLISILWQILLAIVRSTGGGFEATIRVASYTQAASLFNIIPLVGPVIAAIWAIVLVFIGLKTLHDTGYFRIFIALILLPGFLGTVIFLFIILKMISPA